MEELSRGVHVDGPCLAHSVVSCNCQWSSTHIHLSTVRITVMRRGINNHDTATLKSRYIRVFMNHFWTRPLSKTRHKWEGLFKALWLDSLVSIINMPSPSRIHSRRHPTRAQSTKLVASLALVFFFFLSIVLLCPVTVKAENQTHPEYGTVIGIGMYLSDTLNKCTGWLLMT